MIRFGKRKKSLPVQLRKDFTSAGAQFQLDAPWEVKLPLGRNATEVLSHLMADGARWAAIEELWEEDLLRQVARNTWLLSYDLYGRIKTAGEEDENTPGIDLEVLSALGLPFPGEVRIKAISTTHIGDRDFKIRIEATHPEIGRLDERDCPRYGPVFFVSQDTIVPLTPAEHKLFDLAVGDGIDRDNQNERMAYFAKVKEAAIAAGASLDRYLESEDYRFVHEVGLDLREESGGEITLIPRIDGLDEFDRSGGEALLGTGPPAILSRAEGGLARKRMVLADEVRESIKRLPKGGKVRGADVPRLLTIPEQIVPEGFDLSFYSERVKGVRTRVYNSRPYIHVRRKTGGWFDGVPEIAVEDWSPGDEEACDSQEGIKGLSPETYLELAKRAREQGEEYVQHGDDWIRIDPEIAEKFANTVDSFDKKDDGSLVIPANSVLDIYSNLELLEFAQIDEGEKRDDLIPEDLPDEKVPYGLACDLRPYQHTGYCWLSRIADQRIGGLLADDMGLGKTVQLITHMLRLKEKGESAPHLIVVPKSLLENWSREIAKFAPGQLRSAVYGPGTRSYFRDGFNSFDVVLVTYDTLRRDQARLATVDWGLVACDEAQYAKNPTAQRTTAVKALKARHRVALTGTPVENGLIEFWCIMDFVQPGLLGSWSEFRKSYEHPIVEGEEAEREEKVKDLLTRIKGYYLRRLKSDVLHDLPPREVHYRKVPLGERQFELYRLIAAQGREGGRGAALSAIQQLMMLSAHPQAVKGFAFDGKTAPETLCPKLAETLTIIKEVQARDEKVIIFTDYKAVQRILQETIGRRFGLWPDIINGDINNHRQQKIDIFSDKPGFNVMILGHQVAGVGLNIVAANHVIHYTRPWNPAKENQATDRTHRIGQTRPVHIYYPIVRSDDFVTVEERLDEVIRSKEDLAWDVLRPTKDMRVRPEDLLDCVI